VPGDEKPAGEDRIVRKSVAGTAAGKDSDGYWLRNYDGGLTAVAGSMTKTS